MSKSKSKKKVKSFFRIPFLIIGIILLFLLVFFLGNKLTTKQYKSTQVPLSFTVPQYFPFVSPPQAQIIEHEDKEAISFSTEFIWNAGGSLYGGIFVEKSEKSVASIDDYVRLRQAEYLKNCPTQKPVECRFPLTYTYVPFGSYRAVKQTIDPTVPTFLDNNSISTYILIKNGLFYRIEFIRRDPEELKKNIEMAQKRGEAVNAIILSKEQQERAFKMIQDSIKL